jgi:hypothetical protein
MRRAVFCTASVLLLIFFAFPPTFAAVPDQFAIHGIQKFRSPVPFKHKAHAENFRPCRTCHHKDRPGKEENCDICHAGATEREVFHEQCKGCHEKEKSGPVTCDGCHKR